MWSHLSGDFDSTLEVKKSIRELKKGNPGAIFVFHDSYKSELNLKKILPEILTYYTDQGFRFNGL